MKIMVREQNRELRNRAISRYTEEINRWLDLPRTLLNRYPDGKMPSVLREEALNNLNNVQDALEILLEKCIDEERLMKHIHIK